MNNTSLTSKNFRGFVMHLLETQKGSYKGSLEEYLRSLWLVVNDSKDHELNYSRLADILKKAFSVEPPPFDEQWLSFEKPVSWNSRNNGYVIETLENFQVKIVASDVPDFDILKSVLLFQIADLYRMRDNQLKNKHRYLGVASPTGDTWYNFDVFTYLECGTRGIGDNAREAVEAIECDWAALALILELGRIYE